jgi:crotonobetainyl-CoA:carnitine CoA-transferase CaiB-like acyl-CoA transferase
MLRAAASWLITTLPLIDFECDPSEITRSGNEHRKFIPTNAYKTQDGFVYMAQGSNVQWQRFIAIPKFTGLASEQRKSNNGRLEDRVELHADIAAIMAEYTTRELLADLAAAQIPHAPINTITDVINMGALAGAFTRTTAPDGRTVRMQPAAVHIDGQASEMRFPPKYGAHTEAVLAEAEYSAEDLAAFRTAGIIPGQ